MSEENQGENKDLIETELLGVVKAYKMGEIEDLIPRREEIKHYIIEYRKFPGHDEVLVSTIEKIVLCDIEKILEISK